MKVLDIIRKDLKIILSDKRALATILLMPVILTTILSFALKGAFSDGGETGKLQIAVVKAYDVQKDSERFLGALNNSLFAQYMKKEDSNKLAESAEDLDIEEIFFKEFLGGETLREMMEYRITDEKTALKLLDDRSVSAVVILPEAFVYNMKINLMTPFRNKVNIRVVGHPDGAVSRQIIQSIMEVFSDTMASLTIGKNVLIESAMANDLGAEVFDGMKDIIDRLNNALKAIKVDMTAIKVEGKRSVSSFDYYAAAMMTMFILFAAGHGGRLLLDEKENITYQRMITAGVPGTGILAGKFFTIFTLALVQMTAMIAYSGIILKVAWGSLPVVALISLCSAFAVAGVGVTVAAATYKSGKDKMANVFETVIIQTMALLGGSFFPVEILPASMQKLSFISLNGVSLKAYLKIMQGYGLADIAAYIISLLLVGIFFTVLAVLIFSSKGGDEACSV